LRAIACARATHATIHDHPLTHWNSAEPSPVEGFPMRSWSIEIWLLDDQGNEVMPNVFDKAVYNLHPSFEKNKHGECVGQANAG
jgi:transcription initiation factor IIF auxiliary subunit